MNVCAKQRIYFSLTCVFDDPAHCRGRSKPPPYGKRFREFVGYGIYDVPHDRNVYVLSMAFDIRNARHSRYVASAVPYGSIDLLRVWVEYIGKDSGAAVALSQSQINLLLERCCMGVVYQITDLDNSSKPLPYKYTETLSDDIHFSVFSNIIRQRLLSEALFLLVLLLILLPRRGVLL